MIFDGLNSRAFLKFFAARDFNSIKIHKRVRQYMTVLSVTLIPDINLFTPAQCDIGPGPDIHIR